MSDIPTMPSHHVHNSSDPLPGAKRGVNAVDYSAETMERTPSTWDERTEAKFAEEQPGLGSTGTGSAHHHTGGTGAQERTGGQNAFNSERPMDVQPTPEGGVAVGGKGDLHEGHASIVDKVVGKTQKIIGKATHKPEMHEKGELRETGGKSAVQGEARAAHD